MPNEFKSRAPIGLRKTLGVCDSSLAALAQNDSSFGCGHEATLHYPPSGLFVSGTRVSAGGHVRRFQKSWRSLPNFRIEKLPGRVKRFMRVAEPPHIACLSGISRCDVRFTLQGLSARLGNAHSGEFIHESLRRANPHRL
jgi:hypothetical protein